MPNQPCPHCHSTNLDWFRTLPDWIFAVEALGVAYDSHLAYEMSTADPAVYWLCNNCHQGGMAAPEAELVETFAVKETPGVMVVTPLTYRGVAHLIAGHTATYARERCYHYRDAAAMVRRTVVEQRDAAGLHKDGGDDEAFEAIAAAAAIHWRETLAMMLSVASIGDLSGAVRIAMCFSHAFADVVWDELGESMEDVVGADDQARLDTLVALWVELQGSKVNKPVSRKAKQKAEAKLRAEAQRRRK